MDAPIAKATKVKNKQKKLYQIKRLLHNKGNHQQSENQPTEWEKIFANHKADMELIAKIYFKPHTTQ